ncbi:hypothetical protein [Leptolyngbya sp. FACHB-711]|uniref:hypothetical protein n=1 Tax=unclassified Leptolyngbya TaxID=2650499 RepID=UPI001682019D|nr:hypothetical protein [Leptolyngbya sp. FACHB-711]MBD1853858.1 hypothetical protein [Cyanobacteria bacterium FACHB-502]MBD2024993.1 hypothetical protein [Leptolyngbya sp. FACHB-711]
MEETTNQNPNMGDPAEAEPGRGAPGDQWGVQTAQSIAVNDPEARIPSNVDVEQNIHQLEEFAKQEGGEDDLHTTDGYVIDESGRIDNFAIEPPMYIEEHGEKIYLDE